MSKGILTFAEVWDDDNLSPDDLIARTYLPLTTEKIEEFASAEKSVWLQLHVLDDGEDTQENAVTLPSIMSASNSLNHLVAKPAPKANDAIPDPHPAMSDMHDYLDAHLIGEDDDANPPAEMV